MGERPKEDILSDEVKDLIAKVVSETVSKVLKETLPLMLKEMSQARIQTTQSRQSKNIAKEINRLVKTKNSEIIEAKIYDLIKDKGMLLSDLKFLIVDELHYCSKASFYRYVENLKNKGRVAISGRGKTNFIMKQISPEQLVR